MVEIYDAYNHSENFTSCYDEWHNMLTKMTDCPVYKHLPDGACYSQDHHMHETFRFFIKKDHNVFYLEAS